jgi:hypothetical protein
MKSHRPITRLFTFAFLAVFLTACRIDTTVPVGGKVVNESGQDYCLQGESCTTEVSDTSYEEVFTAVPDNGYAFSHWREQEGGFCGGRITPCELSTVAFEGNTGLMAVLESDRIFYLDPVFETIKHSMSCGESTDELSVASNSQGFIQSENCQIVQGDINQLFSDIALMNSLQTISIDAPPAYTTTLRPGDLILGWHVTEELEAFLFPRRETGSQRITPMIYLDTDNNPETGELLHGVVGADLRVGMMTCQSTDFFLEVTGFVYEWNDDRDSWFMLDPEDGFTSGELYTGNNVLMTVVTNSVALGIERDTTMLAVIELEEMSADCFSPADKPSKGSSYVMSIGG